MLETYSSRENICSGRVSDSYCCIKVNNIVLFRFTKRDRNNGGFQRLTVVIVEISFSSLKFPLPAPSRVNEMQEKIKVCHSSLTY